MAKSYRCSFLAATLILLVNLTNDKNVAAFPSDVTSFQKNSFQVCEKTPEKYTLKTTINPTEVIKNLQAYDADKFQEVLQATNFSSLSYTSANGFANAVIDAYRQHHNLIIRPDDVWAAVMVQFSFYVNKNAEQLRTKFVNFEGKKELKVKLSGTLRTASYDLFVKLISDEIHKNLKDPEVTKWVLPSFSTTTDNDLVSIGVILMASLKQYFEYVGELGCGIPSITLDGTVADWEDILERLDKLDEYGLGEWSGKLKPILSQFVEAKKGNVDRVFWEKICQVETRNEICTTVNYVTGWITMFTYFDTKGDLLFTGNEVGNATAWPWVRVDDIPSGVVEVPVTIIEHEIPYNMTMFSGHMAVQVKNDGYDLQPSLGWGIVQHKK